MSLSNRCYIIGAGGAGSWLTPALCLLAGPEQVTVFDGDHLEEKNLNRQLYTPQDIGRNKAEALAEKYHCLAQPSFYHNASVNHDSSDVILVCADNHRARRAALVCADIHNCRVIVMANETHSAEAYYYQPAWQNSGLDPRVYYPEINTDTSNDPMARSMGCTGAAQVETPQLVSANLMAAALGLHLVVLWIMQAPSLDHETRDYLPYKLVSNLSKLESYRVNERARGERASEPRTRNLTVTNQTK